MSAPTALPPLPEAKLKQSPVPSLPPCGRFAPSPTGALHAGSLVAALASWLDARAQHGRWLVRIEDLDEPRCESGAAELILRQLAMLGLESDGPVLYQSTRYIAYQAALNRLLDGGWAYPCGCTRREIDEAMVALGFLHERHSERVYAGTCRSGLNGKAARAMRVLTQRGESDMVIRWKDRRLGRQQQNVSREVGDFIVRRADQLWAYQLAVVVDDAHQGVTHVVRGADLADNTARQIMLQRMLGLPTPKYLHTPLVLAADGHKLSKQNGAEPLHILDPVHTLQQAARTLGLPHVEARSAAEWLAATVPAWAEAWPA